MLKIRFIMFIFCASLFSCDCVMASSSEVLQFTDKSSLMFDDKVNGSQAKNFGQGWASLILKRADGEIVKLLQDEKLTPTGGVVFSKPDEGAISAWGRYVTLDVIRNEIADNEDGGVSVQSRQYCPILDTKTGCLIHDEDGNVCGGSWDAQADSWLTQVEPEKQENKLVSSMRRPNANAVWSIMRSGSGDKLSLSIKDAGGIENIEACDPPSERNASAYSNIFQQLKKESGPRSTVRLVSIVFARAYIYDMPSFQSDRHGYFIKGDVVSELYSYGNEWIFVKYDRKNKPFIEGWVMLRNVEMEM